ncbi:Nucleotide-sugar transporter family protein [Leishmania donovani]|uniref:Nucleotide-sugar transporter family protein n=1 Tax=Leishmania donovani TaxID=5661 RepID=A0A504XMA7_LEIDO|nr:Nucleotide-sugar transporter family protein [Leishmania donovani]
MWVQRYVLDFNAMALVLLAEQLGKEYLLAAGSAKPKEYEVRAATFEASHFLATKELAKLFLSLLWCVVDEARAMQQERCSAEALTTSTAALPAEGSGRSNVAAFAQTPNSVADASFHLSHNLDNVAEDMDAESLDHTVRLRVLFARKRFAAVFLSRMRHAIGQDHKYKETLLMIAPAIVYAIQGLLLIYSLKLLDPTVFQVLYQVRILFLAVMMRVVLDFRLSPIRWGALVALMFGITLAQMGAQSTRADMTTSKADDAARSEMENAAATEKTSSTWSMEGTLAALAGGFLSAFSGVFMEFVVKKRGNQFHLSARNTHLAFFSVVYFFIVFLCEIFQPEEGAGGLDEFTSTFFDGFTRLVWFLVVLQAIGGILVALVVRYCDNIVKSFSTAFAIVLSGTASVFLFHTPLNGTFLLGSFLVLTSITMYTAKK